jgi:hypothetical protein
MLQAWRHNCVHSESYAALLVPYGRHTGKVPAQISMRGRGQNMGH